MSLEELCVPLGQTRRTRKKVKGNELSIVFLKRLHSNHCCQQFISIKVNMLAK